MADQAKAKGWRYRELPTGHIPWETMPRELADLLLEVAPLREGLAVDKPKYVRLYADSEGESHYEQVEVELTPTNFAPPAPPLEVSAPVPASRVIFARARSGWYGDLHPAPRRQLAIILQGGLEDETSDGEVRRSGPGAVVLLEDTTGKGHRTRVVSREDVLAVFVKLPD